MSIYRGTTPEIKFVFKYNLEELNITAFYLTFKQDGIVVFEKALKDMTIAKDTVQVKLTQEETLKLQAQVDTRKKPIYIQGRIKVDNEAYATNIIRTDAYALLKEGVI